MPRQSAIVIENNFSKGLVTETSVLNFPPNACTETFDCVHGLIGNVNRRLGFDFEINSSVKALDRTNGVVVSYLWRDVAGDGRISLVVLQVGEILSFYDASTTDPLSGHPITSNVNLTTFSPAGAPSPKTQECQFASGNGKLFVVNPYLNSFAVSYDSNTQVFTATQIDLKVRDFKGLTDTLKIDERPTAGMGGVTIAHHYNLLNQGWTDTNLTTWDAARTDLPSNSDVMRLFRNSSNAFDMATFANVVLTNSPASKGHFILNIFNKDRQTESGLSITTETSGYQRASTVSFFQGRLFYAGINYAGLNSNILFSQIIERDDQFGECYQTNDPTSEDFFDLLPTDGGVIVIQEAGTILKLVSVPGGLVVFASNGVWVITGSTGLGFTANDYTVAKVSSIFALTSTSFVDLAGTPVWWNLEGIYKLGATQAGFEVVNLTRGSIETFYDSIPPSEKRNARGYFNPIEGVVQWLFRSTEAGSIKEYYEYDRVLNMNMFTGGFYVWTIPSHAVKVHGMVVLENRGGPISLEDVTNNALVVVTTNASTNVQTWTIGDSIVTPRFRYIVSYDSSGDKFTFADTRSEIYEDWTTYGGAVAYESRFISGYKIYGKAITDFQDNYVTFYADNNSKFDVSGQWDFSQNDNSNRWSTVQTIDTTADVNYSVVGKRRRIRGRGKAVQVKVVSLPNEPFDIKGWSVMVSANAIP